MMFNVYKYNVLHICKEDRYKMVSLLYSDRSGKILIPSTLQKLSIFKPQRNHHTKRCQNDNKLKQNTKNNIK